MKFFLFTFYFLISVLAKAQDSTKVRFLVKGGDVYYIRLDGYVLPMTNVHTMARGKHQVEIWSPKFDLFARELETGNLDSTNFAAILEPAASYTSFVAEREKYKTDLFWKRTVPVVAGLAGIVSLPFTYNYFLNSHSNLVLQEFLEIYGNSNVDNAQKQYRTSSVLFGSSLVCAAIGTSAFLFFRAKVREMQHPVYRQQNPFTLEMIELTYNQQYQIPEARLALRF